MDPYEILIGAIAGAVATLLLDRILLGGKALMAAINAARKIKEHGGHIISNFVLSCVDTEIDPSVFPLNGMERQPKAEWLPDEMEQAEQEVPVGATVTETRTVTWVNEPRKTER